MSEMSAEWPFRNNKRRAKKQKILIYQIDNKIPLCNPNGRSDAQHKKLCNFLRSRGSNLRNATQLPADRAANSLLTRLSTERLRKNLRSTTTAGAASCHFSPGKKNLELHWGRGKFEVESGPLGRGPEICQHLTQQGASKGFYTLRML
ncbi:hypothetical protein K7H92_18930 [Pseudomonas stutzeri]|uniref:hypothetical protein n=1 Tax=Stutzerimonas frequens TaxID=2968969 RepID=UPI001E2D8A60|nr:hypothetical protein [Stutzerimonas frequens]MCD1640797.1 hypothetical protein [Stutzerimonas stutzeri]WOC79992.1 hypothetical protein RTE98_05520 [Stutzerimonas frequens]WRW27263.1 hypothetical protein VQ574_00635 [Stutzerimonas frequens]